MDIRFGSFVPDEYERMRAHALALEQENEMLKLQMIQNERDMNVEKSEIMSTCSIQIVKLREELKEMGTRLETQMQAETNMKKTMDEMREELKRKWQKVPKVKDNKNEAKLLEDEKALTEALSEKLKISEQRLAESHTTVTNLQREAEKILALRAILIAELNEQYEAGRQHGYKAFARRAYDFLGRFREGMIDDLISK